MKQPLQRGGPREPAQVAEVARARCTHSFNSPIPEVVVQLIRREQRPILEEQTKFTVVIPADEIEQLSIPDQDQKRGGGKVRRHDGMDTETQ